MMRTTPVSKHFHHQGNEEGTHPSARSPRSLPVTTPSTTTPTTRTRKRSCCRLLTTARRSSPCIRCTLPSAGLASLPQPGAWSQHVPHGKHGPVPRTNGRGGPGSPEAWPGQMQGPRRQTGEKIGTFSGRSCSAVLERSPPALPAARAAGGARGKTASVWGGRAARGVSGSSPSARDSRVTRSEGRGAGAVCATSSAARQGSSCC